MNIDLKRRIVLKGSTALAALALIPGYVAAAWPKLAFENKTIDGALSELLGSSEVASSDQITVKAPEIAENGAVVPVTVSSDLADIESISIIASNNPAPLVAHFVLGEGALGFASTRIKMGKTGDVTAIVKAGGKLYSASKEVKVTIGGCGG